MADDRLINSIYEKIEREKRMIDSSLKMRSASNNPGVQAQVDAQVKECQRNVQYLEGQLNEIRAREGMQNMSMGGPDGAAARGGPDQGGYGGPARGGFSDQLAGGSGMMPPGAPFSPQGPGQGVPKPRPNYSKLDLIKADTQHLGPRYQLMLSQLAFKLQVEKQYKDGIEKVVRLYELEGDKKSRAEAEGRRIECNQKIILLQQALKRYETLNVGIPVLDEGDEDSINQPQGRRPLSGFLSIRIHAVRDVGHALPSNNWTSRKPSTWVTIKVEDSDRGSTKQTKNDRWPEELHQIEVDKANEIELTVVDSAVVGKYPAPIGMLWIRIADIVEEMRRKKIEQELAGSQWMTADQMSQGGAGNPQQGPNSPPPFGGPNQMQGRPMGGNTAGVPGAGVAGQTGSDPNIIQAWFSLEPVGSILLSLSFVKQNRGKTAFDLGLGRKGAVRQRKEEIQERYGHKFVSQQFFNIMRCALCGEFLKYNAGMQCEDCSYLCHQKCYPKVVTKCISKSNADTDPDEIKINHRIPHRFEPFTNLSANWCCHCGYILPVGKKNARKCSECGLACHASCQHLIPDFCGLSTDQIIALHEASHIIKKTPNIRKQHVLEKTLRPQPPNTQNSYNASAAETVASPPGSHRSYGADSVSASSMDARSAATSATSAISQVTPGPQSPRSPSGRPPMGDRTASDAQSAAAAAAAIRGAASPKPSPAQTQPYGPGGQRKSGGYPAQQSYEMPGDMPKSPHAPYRPSDYSDFERQQQIASAQVGQIQQQAQRPTPTQQQPQPSPTQQQSQRASHQQQPHPSSAPQNQVQRTSLPAQKASAQKRIGLEHFNFLAVLGKGNFGKVMLAETKTTKKLYAIKVLKKEFIIENDEVESTRSEKRVLLIANKERHPFMINLHACFQTETRIYFVMEYVSGGDLMLHIQRGQFGLKRSVFYASEVCLALKYFHENGIIYRDLKLDNIMLTTDGHIKVADYGLCKEEMWYGSTTGTFCGTPEFMAPEILLDKKYGRAVDWWAFGVLIYQMLLQQSPFRGEDEDEIYDAILADEPLYPIHMPRDSVAILQKLLTREPEHRLGSGPTDAQEIMSQPFFKNVNWDDVRNQRIPPPYVPQIKNATDTSNFDTEFTSVTPVLTPVQSVLTQQMQEEFRGFSYTGDLD